MCKIPAGKVPCGRCKSDKQRCSFQDDADTKDPARARKRRKVNAHAGTQPPPPLTAKQQPHPPRAMPQTEPPMPPSQAGTSKPVTTWPPRVPSSVSELRQRVTMKGVELSAVSSLSNVSGGVYMGVYIQLAGLEAELEAALAKARDEESDE